jgi:hypothetical protein
MVLIFTCGTLCTTGNFYKPFCVEENKKDFLKNALFYKELFIPLRPILYILRKWF